MFVISINCYSDGKTVVKNSCTWGWQFRAKAKVNKFLGVKIGNSFGCGDLDDAYDYKFFNCVWQKSYSSKDNCWTKGKVTKKPRICGRGFVKSDLFYDLTKFEIDEEENQSYEYGEFNYGGVKFSENQVIIPNLNAEMHVAGTDVSSSIEIVIWMPKHDYVNNIEDTISSTDKHLWYGKAELLNGELILSGDISNESIYLRRGLEDIHNVYIENKTIVVDLNDEINGIKDEIIVSVMSDGGFDEERTITSALEKTNKNNPVGFSVYPNPTTDLISIKFNSKELISEAGTINLYNYSGQFITKIYEGVLNDFTQANYRLSQNNIPSGVYFVSMETANGEVYLQKVTLTK